MSSAILLVFFFVWIPFALVAGIQATPAEWMDALWITLFIPAVFLIYPTMRWLLWFVSGPHKQNARR